MIKTVCSVNFIRKSDLSCAEEVPQMVNACEDSSYCTNFCEDMSDNECKCNKCEKSFLYCKEQDKHNYGKCKNPNQSERKAQSNSPNDREGHSFSMPNDRAYPPKKYGRRNQRWRCRPKEPAVNSLPVCQPTLYGPVGVEFSLFNINYFLVTSLLSDEDDRSKEFQAFATCLIAFGELHITPEEEWTGHVINRVLTEGKKLYENSLNKNHGKVTSKDHVLKYFALCRNAVEVQLSEPVVIGMVECQNARVYSIGVGLSMFLQKYQYSICEVEGFYFLVWKRDESYFLFDCYGRSEKLLRDSTNGNAVLVCVGTIRNIGTVLAKMSDLMPDSTYTLYEVRMKVLLPCCEEAIATLGGVREPNYYALSAEHGILEGLTHIGNACFEDARYKQSLAIALTGVLYSKIDAPCTWDSKIVDEILLMGYKFYKSWSDYDINKGLTFKDIPANIRLGQYVVNIAVSPQVFCGTWSPIPSNVKAVTSELKHIFCRSNVRNLLIQVDRKTYGIWKRNDFYYILDPYPRSIITATAKNAKNKNAIVHMLNSVESLSCVLLHEVIRVTIPSNVIIHDVRVLGIKADAKPLSITEHYRYAAMPRSSTEVEEVESLNQSIYDADCGTKLKCPIDFYDIGEYDLDAPPLSETQRITWYGEDIEKIPTIESKKKIGEEGESNDLSCRSGSITDEDLTGITSIDSEKQNSEDLSSNEGVNKISASNTSDNDLSPEKDKNKKKKDKNKKKKDKNKKKDKDRISISSISDVVSPSNEKGKDKKKKKDKNIKKKDIDRVSISTISDADSPSNQRDKAQKKKDKNKKKKDKNKKKDTNKKKTDKDEISSILDDDSLSNKKDKGKKKKKDKKKKKEDKDRISISTISDADSPLNQKDKAQKKKDKNKKKKDGNKEKKDKDQLSESSLVSDFDLSSSNDKGKKKKDKHKKKKDQNKKEKKEAGRGSYSSDDWTSSNSHQPSRPNGSRTEDSESDSDFTRSTSGSSPITSKHASRSSITSRPAKSRLPGCQPNSYPGHTQASQNMAVVGSETGSYKSLCNLITAGFKVADRILTMTPWGNYAVFKLNSTYFLHDGCTCNPERFRNLDLSIGTAGLLCYDKLHDLLMKITQGKNKLQSTQNAHYTADDICREYCTG